MAAEPTLAVSALQSADARTIALGRGTGALGRASEESVVQLAEVRDQFAEVSEPRLYGERDTLRHVGSRVRSESGSGLAVMPTTRV